jgi:zinc transporter ZupT
MVWAFVFSVAFVAIGGAIGLVRLPIHRVDVVRFIGLGSGVFAVFAQLLPEAAESLGFLALLPFLVALGLSVLVERLLVVPASGPDSVRPSRRVVAAATASIDLGLSAMLAHQLVEGFTLGAIETSVTPKSLAILTMASLTVHTVPILAAFTQAIRSLAGAPAAIVRVALVGVAGLVGALFSSSAAAAASIESAGAWLHGVIAGLLLHAVSHVTEPRAFRDRPRRGVSAAAFLVGFGLAVPSLLAHDVEHLFEGVTGPVVAIGLVTSAALLYFLHRRHEHAHDRRPVD